MSRLEDEARVKLIEESGGNRWKRFGVPTAWTIAGGVALVMVLSFLDRLK